MAFSFLYGKYTRRDPCLNFPLSFFFLSLNGVKGLCFAFPQKKEGPSVGRSSSFFLVGKRRCKGLKVSPPPPLQTFALLFPLCSSFKERPLCLDLRRRRRREFSGKFEQSSMPLFPFLFCGENVSRE